MSNFKIAILSSCTLDLLPERISPLLKESGYDAEFYLTGYQQYEPEIINSDSEFYKFKPDLVLLFLAGEDLFGSILDNILTYTNPELVNLARTQADKTRFLISQINQKLPQVNVLVNNLSVPAFSSLTGLTDNTDITLNSLTYTYNINLSELVRVQPNVTIYDYLSLISYYGYNNSFDFRLWYMGKIRLSRVGLNAFAELVVSYINAIYGKSKKCLVLDLDNTLWGGIIGEDGINGIVLGSDLIGKAYQDLQKQILDLYHKGIILAVNSLNNPDEVKEVFNNHPGQVLKEDHFAVISVNWHNKSDNLKEISRQLNIGLESIVFLDDDSRQRQLVRETLPQVTVPDLPADPVELPDFLVNLSYRYFNQTRLTEEDRTRSQTYRQQIKREDLYRQSINLEEFYRNLEMMAKISVNNTNFISRIAQLTQRTNQFNLTTKRYTTTEITSLINNHEWQIFTLDLTDKFGSQGVVGVIIIQYLDKFKCVINTFLLSCRVIGRTVEDTFLNYVLQYLKDRQIKVVEAQYIPTTKNSLVKDIYCEFGFTKVNEIPSGTSAWVLHLEEKEIKSSPWIKVI